MVSRRRFLQSLTAGMLAAPLAAEAQQPGAKRWRVAVLLNLYAPSADPPQALRQGLRDLGYIEEQNLVIDWRYQLGQTDRLTNLAAELVRSKPDVLVADVTMAIRAAMRATSTIPIVMASSADAVGTGLMANLGQPGANVTGVTIMPPHRTANEVRAGHQSEDGQDPRGDDPTVAVTTGGPGHRLTRACARPGCLRLNPRRDRWPACRWARR